MMISIQRSVFRTCRSGLSWLRFRYCSNQTTLESSEASELGDVEFLTVSNTEVDALREFYEPDELGEDLAEVYEQRHRGENRVTYLHRAIEQSLNPEKPISLYDSSVSWLKPSRVLPHAAKGRLETASMLLNMGMPAKDITEATVVNPKAFMGRLASHNDIGIQMSKKTTFLKYKHTLLLNQRELRERELIPANHCIFEHLLKWIPSESVRDEICEDLEAEKDTRSILSLRTRMIRKYLTHRLETSDFIMDSHALPDDVLVTNAVQIIDAVISSKPPSDLLEVVNWTKVLRLPSNVITEAFSKWPTFLGKHLSYFLRGHSSNIFICGINSLEIKYDFLTKNAGFSDEQLLCNPHLFAFSYDTIRIRTQFWFRTLGREYVLSSQRATKLITHYKKAARNNEYIRSTNAKLRSIDDLLRSHSMGASNKNIMKLDRHVVDMICHKFNWDATVMIHKLRQHKAIYCLDVINSSRVIDYLVDEENLSLDQINCAPYILTYNVAHVRMIFADHVNDVTIAWRQHPLLLDYVTYLIEKNFNFMDKVHMSEEQEEMRVIEN